MQRSDLQTISREVVPGTGTLEIEPIGCGLFNETYRVIRDGCSFTLRLAQNPPPFDLRQDLGWETRVLQAAGRAGLAPPLLYCDPAHGVLASRWVEGRSWSLDLVYRGDYHAFVCPNAEFCRGCDRTWCR